MRVLLFTGKGGVGKTTVAAATAVRAARAGYRTMITSTDPAHSLADSFDVDISPEPTEIAPDLFAEQIDAQERLEANWREIQEFVIQLMNWAGVDTIQAEELTVIPGLDEIFSLIDIRRHVESGKHDLLVVDCAPTAETLRLLVSKITTLPIAEDRVFAAIERLHRNLEAVRKILIDDRISSVRLVLNPEKMVIAEARRTYTYLSLFGYRVDAVVVNRIIPDEVNDPYFGKWKDIHTEHIHEIEEAFQPVPILRARLFEQEMVGMDLLEQMGDEVYGDLDAAGVLHRDQPIRVRRRGPWYTLSMRLPFVERGDIDVHRKGDELYVRVGSYKRSLILPHALQRLDVKQARFNEDGLEVRFAERSARTASAGRA